MQSKTAGYAQFLVELAKASSKSEFQKKTAVFAEILRKRGDARLFPKIVQEFERRWTATEGRYATVITGSELSAVLQKQLQDTLSKKGYDVKKRVREDMGEGTAILLGDSYLIDGTVRGKLQELFNQTK